MPYDPFYWQVHDPAFLRTADLRHFHPTIVPATMDQENAFFVSRLVRAPYRSLFLDIGAYKGDTCLSVARALRAHKREDITVIAFEPNPAYCQAINKTASTHLMNLVCFPYAISNAPGRLYQKQDEGSGTMYDKGFKGKAVECRTLDQFGFHNVALMKLDVEGNEPYALAGATQTLSRTRELYIEMWNDVHYRERHPNPLPGSYNQRILRQIPKTFAPCLKMEKNVWFCRT